MKYLFFDIECSNCFNGIGKMCEFGYVLTDENFRVLKADDIPMSPGRGDGNRFHLKGRKDEKDLELAYEYEFYYEQPEFNHFYNRIKNLVEDHDTICFAYSMDNDIPHLHNACLRYKKEPFKYICYDVQKLVAAYLEKKGQMSLHNACKEIVGPHSIIKLHEHLSRDDAEMERLVFDAICTLTQKSSKRILEESPHAKTWSIEYMSRVSDINNRKSKKAKGNSLYISLVASDEELNDPKNIGRRYNVCNEIKSNIEILNNVISYVKNNNGLFSGKLSTTDIFVVLDEDNKQYINSHIKGGVAAKMITLQEILK